MVLRVRHILSRPCEEVSCAVAMPCCILLPKICVQCNFVSEALPGWQRVPPRILPSFCVPLRLQVPGQVDSGDPVPAALLLPEAEQHGPDSVPDRVQVRPAGHVPASRARLCLARARSRATLGPRGASAPRPLRLCCARLGSTALEGRLSRLRARRTSRVLRDPGMPSEITEVSEYGSIHRRGHRDSCGSGLVKLKLCFLPLNPPSCTLSP